MRNDRRIEDPKLQRALDEIRGVMERYDFPGAVMLVSSEEASYAYKMDAKWSALRKDLSTPLGFRLRVVSAEIGKYEANRRVEAAMHTICQLSDFGEQTTAWMEDIKLMARRAGIEFDHIPFGGRPLSGLTNIIPAEPLQEAEPEKQTEPSKPPNPNKTEFMDSLARDLINEGLLIEAGFMSLLKTTLPRDVPPDQVTEMRMTFFAGAQHVFNSIVRALDSGAEPTDADMARMDAIHKELNSFIDTFKDQHGMEPG